MTDTIHRPSSVAEIEAIVRDAAAQRRPIEIRGGGTKARLGRVMQTAATLDMTGITGITLYEPSELVISARAGTPLREVVAALESKGQMLAFEPMDHRALLGSAGEATIGGIVAAHVSGPRRIQAGACRDALIGAKFVNGKGEEIVSGGRVMKNVTGYDLLKVMAGAHGTLGVLTEVTFKVLPKPAAAATLVFEGLDEIRAIALLCAALGSPFEATGAAHLPTKDGAPARTCLRLEGFATSLAYRAERVADELTAYGTPKQLDTEASLALWAEIRDVTTFADRQERTVWRISTAPKRGPAVATAIRQAGDAEVIYDWSGGLVWVAVAGAPDGGQKAVRDAVCAAGGHATLMRAPEDLRLALEPFEPQGEALMALTRGLKQAFDPAGILNPGRMYAGV